MLLTVNPTYLYTFKYDYHHEGLCRLESRQLFNQEEKDNFIFSTTKVDPSISPFIKHRLEIVLTSNSYTELISTIQNLNIKTEDFTVEYLILNDDLTERGDRQKIQTDIGMSITGEPDFKHPKVIYSVGRHQGNWYFGTLAKHSTGWRNHINKPRSYSNSIDMTTAKSLVTIASKGNKNKQLLDACCGVGTILLEACCSGFEMEGNDIKISHCDYTQQNLNHFGYSAKVHHSDIKDLQKSYDAVIIDLPYNLYSFSTDAITQEIINAGAKLAARVVIVSIDDISEMILNSGLKIIDLGKVEKPGKTNFSRSIWVCERD